MDKRDVGSGFVISRAAVQEIMRHAKFESPRECCGLLLGSALLIEEAHAARNDSSDPRRYRVNPEDHFQAIQVARSSGRSVLGVYHSHPGKPPAPSPTDLAGASYHDYVYLIVSPQSEIEDPVSAGILKAFWLRDGRATGVALRMESPSS